MIVLPVQFSVRHEALLFVNVNRDPNNVRSILMTWYNWRPENDPIRIETHSQSHITNKADVFDVHLICYHITKYPPFQLLPFLKNTYYFLIRIGSCSLNCILCRICLECARRLCVWRHKMQITKHDPIPINKNRCL